MSDTVAPARRRCSTGTRRWASGATCGRSGSGWPRRWTRPSAGWGWTGPATQELIRRSAAEARSAGGRIAAGAGTDQLTLGVHALEDVAAAYTEQLAVVEDAGAQPILMASRALCAAASSPDDYLKVYGRLLEQSAGPVILHWLGEMFDPALAGYWGSDSTGRRGGRADRGARRESGRDQGVAAGRWPGSCPAQQTAGGRAAVHRRRLQLPGADPRRRRRVQRRAARGVRRDRAGRGVRAAGAGRRRSGSRTTGCSRRPCRWPGTCSRRRRTTTRPGSRSWPG